MTVKSPEGSRRERAAALKSDAFTHLPHLRGRVTPAEHSDLRVTPEVLAVWDERAQRLGRGPDWRLSNHALEASRHALLGDRDPAEDLWIYSYGSLMWDPGFHFAEVRLAEVAGYRRRFSYRSTIGRGSAEHPALVLSLEPGSGSCRGLAFRIEGAIAQHESAMVWRREMIRGGYRPTFLPVSTPQGEVTALAFASNDAHADHVGELPVDETAAMIARASGTLGTNRHYLEQVAAQLERLGIEDGYLQQLAGRVRALLSTDPP